MDYVIVLSFVLVVFILVFGSIATQRSLSATQQVFAQLQLIAQTVASQMTTASQSGNGYSSTFSLTSALNLPAYNVTITKTGTVIASANISGRIVQAVAYGAAKSVISSDSYLVSGNKAYVLPTLQGSISIKNSYGNICIDVQCPTTSFQAQNIALSQQARLAANFNGQSSYISVNALKVSTGATANNTVTFWMRWDGQNNVMPFGFAGYDLDLYTPSCFGFNTNNADVYGFNVSRYKGAWVFVAAVFYNGAYTGKSAIYMNGVSQSLSQCLGNAQSGTAATNLQISGFPIVANYYFNGSIANVQLYNTSLSANSVNAIYYRGIGGAPLSSNTLVGWWPLNGDANDYSGYGYNGNPKAVSYSSVSQLIAKVTNSTGAVVSNTLVGFTTNIGGFYNNSRSISNFTNSSGVATAFLNQGSYTGSALVKAMAFQGNVVTVKNLTWWWSMGEGYGANALNIGMKNMLTNNAMYNANIILNAGAMVNTSWANPNYVASFNGQNSYVSVSHSYGLDSSIQYTVSSWVKTSNSIGSIYSAAVGIGGYVLWIYQGNACVWAGTSSTYCSNTIVNNGNWHNIVAVFQSSSRRIYVDGRLAGSSSLSNNLTSKAGSQIGSQCNPKCQLFLPGQIANVQIYNVTLSANQIAQLYGRGLSAPSVFQGGLTGWWPLNGDTVDYSSQHNNGSIGGNLAFVSIPTQLQTSIINNTQAASLIGTNSYVQIPSSNSLNPSNSLTVLAWVNPAAYSPSDTEVVVNKWGQAISTDQYSVGIAASTGNVLVSLGNSVEENGHSTVKTVPLGAWSQVGLVYNGTAESAVLNGKTYVLATGLSGSTVPSSPVALGLGAELGTGTPYRFLNGSLANVQIYNSSLSQSQINQAYLNGVEGFPVSNTVVGWWPLNGDSYDYSGNGNDGTAADVVYGSSNQTLLYSKNGFGINFNSCSRIVLPSAARPTGAHTIEFWVYPKVWSLYRVMLGGEIGSVANGGVSMFSVSNNSIEYKIWNSVTSAGLEHTAPPLNTWTFVTASWNGTSTANALKLYYNGQLVKSTTGLTGPITWDSSSFYVGEWANSGNPAGYCFNGTIANLQIYNTSLTANQIYQDYNNGLPRMASVTVPLGVST
ncbi:MAG: hypothetical protein KGH69_00725 [Candidatus Micrarchaeota archaeon]|nr:hypothetical protein [Candidatus Micrarchaeota archaeon]